MAPNPPCIQRRRMVRNKEARSRQQMTPPRPYDNWLIFAVVSLAALGLLMVASASIVISDKQFHQPFYFLYRQMIGLTLGILLGGLVVQFDVQFLKKIDTYLLASVFLLLAIVSVVNYI